MKGILKSNKIIVLGIVVMLVMSLILTTFAFFTPIITTGNIFSTSGSANATKPNFTYSNADSGISLTNTYPMPDSNGLNTTAYTFSLTSNESTRAIKYNVILETKSTNTLDNSLISYSIGSGAVVLTSNSTVTATTSGYSTGYVIYSGTLTAGEVKQFDFRVWINSNGTVDNAQNKTWESKIVISASFS